jgi:predicted PurR-regulated permease PerM
VVAGLAGFGAATLLIGENFVQPALIGGAARLPFLLVLIGIIGGMQSFGLLGLFLGPVIMVALLTIGANGLAARIHRVPRLMVTTAPGRASPHTRQASS